MGQSSCLAMCMRAHVQCLYNWLRITAVNPRWLQCPAAGHVCRISKCAAGAPAGDAGGAQAQGVRGGGCEGGGRAAVVRMHAFPQARADSASEPLCP